MVELQEAQVTEQVEQPEAPQTAGSLLRQAREAAGMHVFTLADVLKVPVAKLQALEADDWKTLPDAVFTRSLALSICKALHVDATPIMALMPKAAAAQKFTAPGPGINEPFRDKAVRSVHDTPSSGAAWKVLGLALVAGAAGAAWYFSQQQGLRDAVVASVQERSERAMGGANNGQPVAVAAVEQTAPAVAPVAESAAAPAPEAAPAPTVAAPAAAAEPVLAPAQPAEPAHAVAAAPVAVAPAPVSAPAAESPAAAPAGAATLRIQARAATWIQVRGGGKVLEQKTLNAGEFFETHAPKPLSVVVGRAEAAEVQVDGAAFDLASIAKVNVARFEVK